MEYTLEIFINEVLADVDNKTKFSLNLKGTDISNLTTRSINYTGVIKLPFTKTNDTIYELARHLNNNSGVPYTTQAIRISINGIPLITDGVHKLAKSGNGYYELRVLSSQAEFFNVIKDKKLAELDFTDLNQVWSIDDTCDAFYDVVSPFLSYGRHSSTDVDEDIYLPSIYWATIIHKIFIDNGFTKFGQVFATWEHLKTIMPYSKSAWEYTEKFATDKTINPIGLATQGPWALQPVVSELDTVNFDTLFGSNPFSYFDFANERYEISNDDVTDGAAMANADHQIGITLTVSGGTVAISLYEEGTGSLGTFITGIGTGYHTYTLTKPIRNKRYLKIILLTWSGTPTVTVSGVNWQINVNRTPSDFLFFQELMPDINQIDLIKEFAVANGVMFGGKGNHIDCYKIEDVIRRNVPAVGPLDEWEEGPQAYTGPSLPWTTGAAPQVFTSLSFPETKYLWFPYPTRKTRTYQVTYNIDFGANGSTVYFEFLDERGQVSTPAHIGVYNTGTVGSTVDIFSEGNGCYLAMWVGTGGLGNTTIINSVSIVDLNPEATYEDWTGKRTNRKVEDVIDYGGLGYAQSNLFSYGNIDELTQLNLFQKAVLIANTNLPLSKIIFTSLFSASRYYAYSTIEFTAEVLIYNGTETDRSVFANAPGLRLLMVRQNLSTEGPITFNTSQTSFKVAYWTPLTPYIGITPDKLVENNYKALFGALQEAKVVTREYDLSLVDIANFRFDKPVFDEDVMLLKISAGVYTPGKSLTVTFLKIQ